jgi:hypothetical protein
MIEYLNSAESKSLLKEVFALARRKFKDNLMYEIDAHTQRRWDDPHNLCVTAYDTDQKEVVSYFSWMVTDTRFRDGLLAGSLTEHDLYPYDESAPAILYFDTFVVTDAHHSPPIIHRLCNDLKALIIADQLDIVGGLSIGGLRFTEKWLKKYGFKEIGRYKEHYPILYATREESVMLNTICTPHGAVTGAPWRKTPEPDK